EVDERQVLDEFNERTHFLIGITYRKLASTPIDTEKPLLKDPDGEGEDVDVHTYRSMIGSLMYLTSSRPDIMFDVCACARFQVTPKSSHLYVVKRIFRYLKGKPHLGLWYPKDSLFNLVAYFNSDYAGASLDRKSTTGGCQFLGCRLISWQYKKQTVVATSSTETSVSIKKSNDVVRLQALIDRKKVIIIEDLIRQALRLDDADSIDCLPNEEIFAKLARMGYEKPSTKLTFYKEFFSAKWKFLIHIIIQCMSAKRTAWNEFSSSMASRMDDVNEVSDEPTPPSPTPATSPPPPQQEYIPSPPQADTAPSSPPSQQQHSQTVAISMTLLNTLLETWLKRLKKVMIAQRVESSVDTVMDDQEDASKWRGGIAELDADEDVTLKEVAAEEKNDADIQGRLEESQAKVCHLDLEHADKVLSIQETDDAEPAEVEEVIKVVTAAKLMTEVVTTAATTTTTATTIIVALVPKASAPRRRRGVIIQDPNEAVTTSKIMQSKDEAFARELEAKLNVNINWNEVIEQVKRKERQDNTFMRYQALKRKPVTEAQARKNMMHFNSIWAFLEKGEKEIEEEKRKRKSENLKQKAAKKQKINEEIEELKTHLHIVPNDEDDVYTEANPLALKVYVVDYQIHNEHNKLYYKIIRVDETHQLFLSFITLLRNFDREDLEMLWKLVQERYQSLDPKNFSNDFLLTTLKTMFEKPNVEASI
nr:hypothetical protein [Tanacetum cinerariifolium]